ncbi:MAG: tryptophan--tRNA ligase [Candidatus Aenigmatarchaeota archaeon]
MAEKMVVTPWEVSGKIDYDQLIKGFGMKPFARFAKILPDNVLFRRGIVYGHRDFERIADAIKKKKEFVMMTGLMPTGKFHLGHKILADQIIYYQSHGAKVYVAVADIEAYNTRLGSMKELKKTAIEEYLLNYIALGLKPKNCDFYFQSNRSSNAKKANAYYKLAGMAARHITFNEMKAIYGAINPGRITSALFQASDMFHPELPEFGGPKPVVVPVGFDQDPHLRLARDIGNRIKEFKFIQLSSTYHKFVVGLKGGKMSSSDPTSFIALTDSPEEAAKKIRKHAFSGGQETVEMHRKKGGNPDIDVSYQWLYAFFEPNDKKIKNIHDDYKSGALLTGELKEYLIKKVTAFLKEHQKKREKARNMVDKFLVKD